MNKKLLILSSLLLSYNFTSSTQDTCDVLTNYTSAHAPSYTYSINFTPMMLKPSSDLNYAAEAFPLPIASPSWQIHSIPTDYAFAFNLGARVILHEKNSLLMGNWEHFLSSNATSNKVALSTNMVGPFFEIGPDAIAYTQSAGSVNYELNKLNIDYGQFIEIGQNLTANLFAGISFSRLRQNITMHYSNAAQTIMRDIDTTTSFTGVGPQIGLELAYKIHKGLNFITQVIGDLQTGTMKSYTQYAAFQPLNTSVGNKNPNIQSTSVPDSLQIVPVLSQKIGIGYEYLFKNHCAAQAEIGYQAQIYINAINSVTMGSEVVTPPIGPDTVGVFARTFHKSSNNFALSGPYLNIQVSF